MKINKKCAPRTAVAYARYSSAGQRDVSIEQQLNDIRAYAQREGYTIIHEYADRAKSGYKNTSARIEFQKMLTASWTGLFDTVIAWKVDRFGRNRRDSTFYKGQLRDIGVNVVYAMEPIPEGAAGVLTEGMLESIAEWYSRNLSENVTRGMNDNARKALYNGNQIFGYRRGPDDRYEIDPDNAAIVRMVFRQYLDGYSAGSIARGLNAQGFRTSYRNLYSVNSVLRIIGNERYCGIYIWGGIRIPGGMPIIISRDDWEAAQLMREKTGRHHENDDAEYLLTGKVFCGLCGKPMVGDSGKSKVGTVYHYYTCSGRKTKSGLPRTCDKKPVRREHLEKTVLDFIYDHCLTGPEREKIADAIIDGQKKRDLSSPRAALEADLKETEKKIANLNDAIAAGVWSKSTVTMLNSLEETADNLRSSIASIDLSQTELIDRNAILFHLSRMATYKRDDPVRQKQLIRTFINAVFIFDDHLKIALNAVECDETVTLQEVVDESDFSDSVTLGSPNVAHPNPFVVVYSVAM